MFRMFKSRCSILALLVGCQFVLSSAQAAPLLQRGPGGQNSQGGGAASQTQDVNALSYEMLEQLELLNL